MRHSQTNDGWQRESGSALLTGRTYTSTKKKILIVEDQVPMRRNIALLLAMEGFEVVPAGNGVTGVEAARREHPDLILCDVMMPEMDGYGVVQALRADKDLASIPFVFLTTKGDKADIRIGMNFGADDYLTKPVIREDLLAAVHARLARAETFDERMQDAVSKPGGGFNPDFSSPGPLQREFGLTAREAEVLLWAAQGKSNLDVATIVCMSDMTVKQHMGSIFQKMRVEGRNAASLRAVEVLGKPPGMPRSV